MNIQTIQILFLLLDSIIKLAPWRIVTETMDRIGYGASESLARSLGVIAVSCAGLCTLPPTPVIGPLLLTGYLGGAMASHVWTGSPLFSHILFGFYLGVMAWGGLCGGATHVRDHCDRRHGACGRPRQSEGAH